MSHSGASNCARNLALLAAVAVPCVSAKAVTFTFDGTEGVATYSKAVEGITLSMSNPTEISNVFVFGIPGPEPDLGLSSPSWGFVSSFDFSFNTAVRIDSYVVSYIYNTAGGSFTLSAPRSETSAGNSLASEGTHEVAGGGFIIAADTVGTWTTSGIPESSFVNIRSITVSAVPEPGEWTMIAGALCGFGAFLQRRRRGAGAQG